MATFADLTDAQKEDITRYDAFLRSVFLSLAKAHKASNSELMNQFSVDNVDPVLATLDADESIPNSTGYDGAKNLTVAELKTLQAIARGMSGQFASNVGLLVKAIGVNLGS